MDTNFLSAWKRRVIVATSVLILSGGWVTPAGAVLGLLPPLPGSLIVVIDSPAAGATVSGATTVSARVSIVGALTVAGVQFKLDGVNLGAEDRSAPYSITWNTANVSNGSHTLVAVARDALGLRYNSEPVRVTVSNDTTPPTVSISAPASGATVSGSVEVTAAATDNTGVAGVQFKLDGANLGAEDTSAPYSIAWNTVNTSDGPHTLTAVARDAAGNVATSSAVTVTVANAVSPPPPPPPPSTTRIEETNAAVVFSGDWVHGDTTYAWSGTTASYSRGPAARASLSFTGTRVSWIGWREPRGGIARVILDGTPVAEVDLYAVTPEAPVPVYTSGVLASGSHTLVIEVTGTANPSASGTIVVVDAFDVTSSTTSPPPPPPPSGTVTRVEESDAAIVYGPGWIYDNTYGPWSGGSAVYSVDAGAHATFSFTGTGVSWIGYRGRYGGIVQVYLDGALAAEIDTYSATEEIAVPVYTRTGLATGSHSLRVELTGRKNPAATNSEIAVDAFDVTR